MADILVISRQHLGKFGSYGDPDMQLLYRGSPVRQDMRCDGIFSRLGRILVNQSRALRRVTTRHANITFDLGQIDEPLSANVQNAIAYAVETPTLTRLLRIVAHCIETPHLNFAVLHR